MDGVCHDEIRVLHVDDDRDLRETVAIHLERVDEDLQVVTETSAADDWRASGRAR